MRDGSGGIGQRTRRGLGEVVQRISGIDPWAACSCGFMLFGKFPHVSGEVEDLTSISNALTIFKPSEDTRHLRSRRVRLRGFFRIHDQT